MTPIPPIPPIPPLSSPIRLIALPIRALITSISLISVIRHRASSHRAGPADQQQPIRSLTTFRSEWSRTTEICTATSLADVDVNPANNAVEVVFSLSARVVDAMSLPAMALLICGVLLIVSTRRMGL